MARMLYIALITITIVITSLIIGYRSGINKAMTAEGYVEGNSFFLELDGNLYEWYIDGE